jgi:hypothetical protein
LASDFLLRIVDVIEDEMTVVRIEANKYLLTRIGAADGIPLMVATQRDLPGLADLALSGEGGQIDIYPVQVKEGQLVLWAIGTARFQ